MLSLLSASLLSFTPNPIWPRTNILSQQYLEYTYDRRHVTPAILGRHRFRRKVTIVQHLQVQSLYCTRPQPPGKGNPDQGQTKQ